jgi:hypothetical protein
MRVEPHDPGLTHQRGYYDRLDFFAQLGWLD